MAARYHRLPAACAVALLLAAPALAGRPARHHAAPPPGVGTVTVHHGTGLDTDRAQFAAADAPWPAAGIGYPPTGFWESNHGREDDAAIFAARYGCVRPIWNAKSNRYMAACN